ncbi:hypothetical protein [Vibrio crassostreae]|uniref:hypothetical protein n=1 Tax=Vibrio crassostreae TaxID=246167 RepID=UPI001B3109FA|nr:hypothetical protein [Vibrio crassostreae]
MTNDGTIPLNVVNTKIDWNSPLELQNGIKVSVIRAKGDLVTLGGNGFSVVVTTSTGLPICDVFNWGHFPVKNVQ